MSKTALAAYALGLLLVGFGVGYYVSTPPKPPPMPETFEQRSARLMPERAAVTQARAESRKSFESVPARPTESGNAVLDLLRKPESFEKISTLATLLSTLDPETLPEVRAAIHDRATDLYPVDVFLLVRFWATQDPEGAARWAMLKAPPAYRGAASLPAVQIWAKVDPQAAREAIAAASMTPGENLTLAQVALVRGWAESDVPGLNEYMQGLGVGFDRQRAVATYARAVLLRDGPEAIMRWAESLPDDDERYKLDAFRQVGSELAKVNPDAATAWCDAHCDGPYGSMIRTLVAQRWANYDGKAAMEWVAAAPPGQERDWAVRGAYRGWFRKNRPGFEAWVNAMGPGGVEPWFQPVLEVWAINLAVTDPERAIEWAGAIDDDLTRERTLVTCARVWRKQDEQAADAWLAQSPLSDEARARARTPAKAFSQKRDREAVPSIVDPTREILQEP